MVFLGVNEINSEPNHDLTCIIRKKLRAAEKNTDISCHIGKLQSLFQSPDLSQFLYLSPSIEGEAFCPLKEEPFNVTASIRNKWFPFYLKGNCDCLTE